MNRVTSRGFIRRDVERRRVEELVAIYSRSSQRLLDLYNKSLDPGKRRRYRQLVSQMNQEVALLNKRVKVWGIRSTSRAYKDAVKAAARHIKSQGVETGPINFNSVLHRRAINALAKDATQTLLGVNANLKADMMRAIRATRLSASLDAKLSRVVGESIAEGLSEYQSTQRVLGALGGALSEGKIIRVGTRAFAAAKYAQLVARTRFVDATAIGALSAAAEFGMDLVQVSVHNHPEPDPCTPYIGRVYSISGSDSDFPALTARPPFHPNCRHILLPVNKSTLEQRGDFESLKKLSRESPSKKDQASIKAWAKRHPEYTIRDFNDFKEVRGR